MSSRAVSGMTSERSRPEEETREFIVARQTERLRTLLDAVVPANPFWTRKFQAAGIDAMAIRALDDLPRLPLTEKAELVADQAAHPPYGSNLTYPLVAYSRMHQTSGTTGRPLRWLDTPESWSWFLDCWRRIFEFAGITAEDRVAFPFSFGPFIGFWAAFDGANRLGNLCLAGGGMSSEARLRLIEDNHATFVCCTPTYALRLAEVADQMGIDLASGSVRALIVAGEPGGCIPATRERIESAWGARLFDHWGMTEIGSLATEAIETKGSLSVLETECIAEILDVTTHAPVAAGELGELVVTNLGRLGSPLIRYRTGDLVRADTSPDPAGRALLRLQGGILGRADDMVSIRGNNVFPSSLEAILREFPAIAEYRITVETRRAMNHLRIEIEPTDEAVSRGDHLVAEVSRTITDRLNFQADVQAVAPRSLPRFELKGRRFHRVEGDAAHRTGEPDAPSPPPSPPKLRGKG
ncbi:MAG: AMP-binding protein [Planctomycetaceae bacterium]